MMQDFLISELLANGHPADGFHYIGEHVRLAENAFPDKQTYFWMAYSQSKMLHSTFTDDGKLHTSDKFPSLIPIFEPPAKGTAKDVLDFIETYFQHEDAASLIEDWRKGDLTYWVQYTEWLSNRKNHKGGK